MTHCKICNGLFANNQTLASHIRIKHKIPRKEYYDQYLRSGGEGICSVCGKETAFRGNTYLKFCSLKCYNKSDITSKQRSLLAIGRKQSAETIQRRVLNTDQQKKQKTRENTLLARYGNKHYNNSEQARITSTGKKRSPRTKEHSEKIAISKRNNGTNKHTQKTKDKIKESVTRLYASESAPITISKNNTYVCGYFNNIYYRSSYELQFLSYCKDNNIDIISADTKEFRIRYFDNKNSSKFYYPDFYIPQYNVIAEIKPSTMLNYGNNPNKIHAARLLYNYIIITEKELANLDNIFKNLIVNKTVHIN